MKVVTFSFFIAIPLNVFSATAVYENLVYRSRADSPFSGTISAMLTVVEDFEDGSSDTFGLSLSPGELTLPDRWSVDEDDGVLDNTGIGFSWRTQTGTLPGEAPYKMELRFSPGDNGKYPTHAGLVILGYMSLNLDAYRYFVAFDQDGVKIPESEISALIPHSPGNTDQFSTVGDRFFGLIHEAGISRILVSGTHFDHIQFGYGPIPEPGSAGLALAALAGLGWSRQRRIP